MRVEERVWDVLVLGGGLAGCAAAAEAAAAGKSALLVERRPVTGWELAWAHAPELSAGTGTLYAALRAELEACGALSGARVDPALAAIVLDATLERLGVRQLLYAQPLSLVTGGGRAQAALVAARGGQLALRARALVDATELGLLWGRPARGPAARSRFSVYLWVPAGRPAEGRFGEAGPARYIKTLPGVWPSQLELCYEMAGATAAEARLALPEVLRRVRESGELPAEAVVTHTAPEVLPIETRRLEGSPGEPHPSTANLFGAGQWLVGYSAPEDVLAELTAWGSQAGAAAAQYSSSAPEPPPVSAPAKVAPPRQSCEVLVAGAGTAGAIAALAAARRGCRTTLVEAGTAPGGIGTCGGIHSYYCGLPGGLQDEVDARTRELTPLFAPAEAVQGFHPEAKKCALEAMLREAGVEVRYGTMLAGAVTVDEPGLARQGAAPARRLREAVLAGPEGSACCSAEAFVDSTGDADLAAWAGAGFVLGRESDGLPHAYSLSAGRMADGKMRIVNFDAGYVDPTDSEDLTRAQRAALALYRRASYSDADRPTYIAPLLGLRSGRQVLCDHQLRLADQVTGARFPDAVAESIGHYDNHGWDYEFDSDEAMFWIWVLGHWHRRLACEVPYRCLLPRGVEGLLVACRAAGVSYDAHMMLRMQNDMQRLGEAAGLAAALAVRAGVTPRRVDVGKLRAELVASGAMRPPDQPPRFAEQFAEAVGTLPALPALPAPDDRKRLAEELAGQRSSETLLALASPEAAGGTELVRALREAARSDDPAVRFRAAAALAMRGDTAAVPGLLRAVRERQALRPAPACRSVKAEVPAWVPAMALLGRLGEREAVPDLVAVLDDPTAGFDELCTAVRALGRIGDATAAPALEKLLARADIDARRMLQKSSGVATAPPLDARWQLDLAAAEALARMGVPRPDVAGRYAEDERGPVRRRAAALKRLIEAAARE